MNAISDILKRAYSQAKIENFAYTKNPMYSMVYKYTNDATHMGTLDGELDRLNDSDDAEDHARAAMIYQRCCSP